MKETSIEVYHKIKENGLLRGLELMVYRSICEHGTVTQMETVKNLGGSHTDHSITPRFAPLVRKNAIREVGRKTCGVTGEYTTAYSITGDLPVKLTKREKLERLIDATENKLNNLRLKLSKLED